MLMTDGPGPIATTQQHIDGPGPIATTQQHFVDEAEVIQA